MHVGGSSDRCEVKRGDMRQRLAFSFSSGMGVTTQKKSDIDAKSDPAQPMEPTEPRSSTSTLTSSDHVDARAQGECQPHGLPKSDSSEDI